MHVVDESGGVLPNDGQSVRKVEVRGPWITGSYYRDRAKDVITSGGEWISSVELENHIMGLPDVVEAAVVGVPDERWQERSLAAVLLKCLSTGATRLSARQGGSVVAARRTIIDEVPRTSVGKVDKKVIRARYADEAYDIVECAE